MHNILKNSSKPTKLEPDAIVISGISGIYPNADNNLELCQKLYNKVNMVSKDVYPETKHLELPLYFGKINGIERFDSHFFRVTPNQAHSFEPVGRKVMEQAYSAMFDAGVNPETMKGTNLGVFVGFAQSDVHSSTVYNLFNKSDFILSGTSKSMLANRVSYWVDAKGPSLGVDAGCASSMVCLQLACEKISTGECDAAVVCGTSHNTQPVLSLNMRRAGLLCLDEKTKCFDKNGDGYVRSEAVNVLFLQKAMDAKRIYAEICHVKGIYSPNTDSSFLPIRNPKEIEKFLKEFYSEININPEDVDYIEANATGIFAADRSELEGISNIFGKNNPIKIGSIKSNLGHTESASGIVSVTKICLAYQKGELPANLHYTEPIDIPAVKEGKLQIVTDNTSFVRGYAAINNFSFTGASYHALLKGHFIPKDVDRYATNLPQLILVSGRHEEGVNKILEVIENDKLDPEQIALLRAIFKFDIPGHTGRGFSIYDSEDGKTVTISKNFEYYSGSKRPVCFLYSGLGSQWIGMGKELMNIPIFADAIHKCNKVLKPKGLDLEDMITNLKEDIVDNILHSVIGITAIQIGLTDVLMAIGITPDFIIGHSLGEIGCAYADGCFTREEVILFTYFRGYVACKIKYIKGKMAAVGLGYKKIQELIPSDIDIACRNSSNSTTISGPAEIVDKFVNELKERNIFAKTVPSSNIAFHSRYIAEAESELLSLLKELKIEPKRRSSKWLSTCYIPEEWENKASLFASAEYFTYNLLNQVHFEEAANHIPDDAVIIEVSPHGLMQTILNKSHESCIILPLTRRNHDNNIKIMFEAIGKLYQNGSNPDVSVLYPKVDFPVSTETPGLSHLVQWDHSREWKSLDENNNKNRKSTGTHVEYIFSMYDDDYKFIREYLRNGKNIYPESSLLVLVWKTLAMYNNINHKELSVKFSDVKFYDNIVIESQEVIILNVSVQKGSNTFEVTNKDKVIVNGTIQKIDDDDFQNPIITIDADDLRLTKNEVYKFFSMHGFNFGPSFQCIEATNCGRNKAIVKWNNDWTTFLDSVIQLNLLSELDNTPSEVKRISSLSIHATKHFDFFVTHDTNTEKYVYSNRNTNGKTFCGGIVCESVIFEQILFALSPSQIFIEEFIPHFGNHPVNVSTAVHINMQIVYENTPNNELLVNFIEFGDKNTVNKKIKDEISKILSFKIKLKLTEVNDVDNVNLNFESDVVVCPDFKNNKMLQNVLIEKLDINSFIMLVGDNKEIEKIVTNNNLTLLTHFKVHNLETVLLRKRRVTNYVENPIIVSNVDDLKFEIQNNKKDTIVIFHNISEFIPKSYKYIIKDQLKQKKAIYLVDIHKPPSKSLVNNTHLKEQAGKGLVINVLRNKEWGGYYSIPYKSDVGSKNVELTETLNITTECSLFITNNNRVQIYYSAFCQKDCKNEMVLKNNKKSCFAMDFSGIDSNGKRVMGCIPGGSITIDSNLLWPVPEHWSLEDAATIPLPYLHAYYCLVIRHQLKRKSTVLVTEGASALGQALLSLCISMGCRIFTTVSSEQKKAYLMRIFPQLNDDNIRLTFDSNFVDFIINSTSNERCNVVLNCSLSGDLRQIAMACVSNYGSFLDICETDMKENELFNMGFLNRDKEYISIRLASLFSESNEKSVQDKEKLQNVIAEGIAKGIVKPLLRMVFPQADISKALNLLVDCPNLCRILMNMNDRNNYSEENKELKEKRLILHSKGVYIVIWDGSEFGVEFVNRLIEKGAKYLIIHTKLKTLTGYYLAKSLSWTSVKIEISNENLDSVQGCTNLIENGMKMGDLDGLFIINSDFDKNKSTTGDSVDLIGTNLDITTRNITTLSYFASLKLVTYNDSGDTLAESERYFMERYKLGIPSLKIVFKFQEMKFDLNIVSTILDGFEKSLKCKSYNVLVTDQEKFDRNRSKLPKSDMKKHIFEDKLKIFVDDINSDECQATEPIISMRTLTSKFNEDEIQIDPDDPNAIMISGFLGHYKKLSNIAERLKISAIGLQISPDMNGNIPQLAENLLQYIKIKYRFRSKFYIVAYSFGVNIALELTALLEKEGFHGIVFCLDSSPSALQHQFKAYFEHLTEEQLQNSIIQHTYTLLTGASSQNLKDNLNKCENWSKKIEAFINDIKKVVSHSHEYLKDVVNAIYQRILLAIEYKPEMVLNSEIVLIKGLPDPTIDTLPEDYDLSKFTSKPVKVINITSDHVSLPYDNKISNIINGMLEPELIKLFEIKNMCEEYFG